MPDPTIAVVGAGALGAASAWHLARETSAQVRVLDRGRSHGATPQGAGLITPLVEHPEDVGLVQRSRTLYERLSGSTSFSLEATGGVLVHGPEHRRLVDRRARMWRAHGVETRAAKPDALAELPGCRGLSLDADERAHVSPADAWADPAAAVDAMLDEVRAAGGTVDLDARVDRVDGSGVHLASGERVPTDRTVLAAGVWTPALLDHAWRPPILAYRAQAVHLDHALDATPGPVVHDAPHDLYWRPSGAGALAGDGTDLAPHEVAREPEPDPDIGERLAARLAARCPTAAPVEAGEARAGYAAGTPDTRPLVGPAPGLEEVVLCTGANGFGFMRAPALGELAAQHALDRAPTLPARGGDPARFEDPPAEFPLAEGFSLDAPEDG